jgi:hypothetical protein
VPAGRDLVSPEADRPDFRPNPLPRHLPEDVDSLVGRSPLHAGVPEELVPRGRDIVQSIAATSRSRVRKAASTTPLLWTKQGHRRRLCILYANTEVMLPAVYAKPRTRSSFRFVRKTANPIGRRAGRRGHGAPPGLLVGPGPGRGPRAHRACRQPPRGARLRRVSSATPTLPPEGPAAAPPTSAARILHSPRPAPPVPGG